MSSLFDSFVSLALLRGILLSVVAPWVTIKIFQLFFASKKRPPIEKYDLQKLRRKYQDFTSVTVVGILFIVPLLVVILTFLFFWIYQLYLHFISTDAVFIEGYQILLFAFPAMPLGFLIFNSIAGTFYLVLKRKKIENTEEFRVYEFDITRRMLGGAEIDTKKMEYGMITFLTLISTVLLYLSFDTYIKATENEIAYNDFLSLVERKYQYSDVKQITFTSPWNNPKPNSYATYYEVIMADGYKWSTFDHPMNMDPKEAEMIQYISLKSGVPIQ